ncbi:MAG: tRNA (uridine(34)/cytosine(34)/5-carboxymethylaminomethyluridine(34)-2'-O)-methyltransferase TrmL [Myxococcales bacterium]|nr:tRNA (uridine(34)/cytosine(34)/5-carboxymethylaminomethyluridine(34)-2'-O)-methyltransferase TrmL [Myxococcales bacterium]
MMHVVLVHPQIPGNTGSAGRTCLAAGARLHLVEPIGFSLDEARVRRAGLDYWPHVDLQVHGSWEELQEVLPAVDQGLFFTRHTTQSFLDEPPLPEEPVFVFGSETKGLPSDLLEAHWARRYSLPILSPHVRSLNLSNTVTAVVYEGLRRQGRR